MLDQKVDKTEFHSILLSLTEETLSPMQMTIDKLKKDTECIEVSSTANSPTFIPFITF